MTSIKTLHLVNINGGNADSSFYTIHVSGNNQSPDTFPATTGPTLVTLGFGSYSVVATPNNDFIGHNTAHIIYSEDCAGVIHPDETKTCTIDILYNPDITNP
ncbi:MAG: hypothetical protein L0H55_08295 [Candidatus Nitrosocosmicus sp.]|nr:hypothetical protein [Candidatus Nitrosocosmicus sp.]